MKAYIETFGCQMNEYDTERILYYLENLGYSLSEKAETSDIIILNTCAVREKAKNKLYGHIGNLKKLKERKPNVILCVGGCTAQSMGTKIQKDFYFVDIVFGTHNISELPELIKQRVKGKKNICSIIDDGFDYDLNKVKRISDFQALIPITIGCDNFCSYCIVPYVRGREKSVKPETVIKTIRKMVSEGVIEITLLGQNVNSYGKDLKKKINFPVLLDKISDISGLERIRFMTSHPKDFSPDLIEIIRIKRNIVNHIHLPLQAGSDKILKKMNRKYTSDDYLGIVSNIREKIRSAAITTDIIVGFPGENYRDFKDTLDIVERVRFLRAFTFIYSARKGTSASNMKDTITIEEKNKWFNELIETQNQISLEENKKFIGRDVQVLVESRSQKDSSLLEGRMENNIIVNFEGNPDLIGKIINAKIISAKTFYLKGELII